MTEESVAGASRHRRWRLAAVVAAGITAAAISSPTPAGASADPGAGVAGTRPGEDLTGIAARVLSRPSPVRGTDGRFHLAYELVLTSGVPLAVNVDEVEVRDPRTGRAQLSLSGSALSSRMNPVGGTPVGDAPGPPTLLEPSGSAIVWLDLTASRKANLPDALQHRVVSSTRPPPGDESVSFTSLVGRVSVRDRAPVKLGPPVRSGIWGAGEGCCDNDTHHRRGLLVVSGKQVVPQRYAIDWMRLDEQHRAWIGDPHDLSSYLSYGQPLIAAAPGKVVIARDEFPNQQPPDNPTPPAFADLPGNHVTLRIGSGIYMIYAHMKPGSVRVDVGDRVRRGQMLGRLGNSGNSATPHLHLQLQTTDSFVSDGLPFVFKRFRLLGEITSPDLSDEILGLRPNGQLPFAPASKPGNRRRQMPLDRSVVRFPDAR